jgi:gamma-glutamyltranspeptidase / glutathione hydrolase
MKNFNFLIVIPLVLCLAGCTPRVAEQLRLTAPPEIGKRSVGENAMVVTAHPLSTEIGMEILRQGGNAVDAMVAAAFALSVVEPMMGGLGGGGGMLIYLNGEKRIEYVDFYQRSPAHPDYAVLEKTYDDLSPLAVAVPGTVPGLLEAHKRFGRMTRAQVIEPAIRIAEEGFPVHGLLARVIEEEHEKLTLYTRPSELFFPDGKPLQVGELLRQPELAYTLRQILLHGRDGFHGGEIAREIVSVLEELGNPIGIEDMQDFKPRWKRPMCGTYRGRIVFAPPPSKSGMQILQALNLIEQHDLGSLGLPTRSAASGHLIASALRMTSADREHYLGDPLYAAVPAARIASKEYAQIRVPELADDIVPQNQNPGDPFAVMDMVTPPPCQPFDPYVDHETSRVGSYSGGDKSVAEFSEHETTTHLSVIDTDGNAVSLTFTIGMYFGSGVWAAGTFLNSSQHILSADPESPNALGAGRTPRSTTIPTIVLDANGDVELVIGAAGGPRIPSAVFLNLLYVIDYGMDPMEAIRMPRLHPSVTQPEIDLEHGFSADVIHELRKLGYNAYSRNPYELYFGGVHMIGRRAGVWIGAADPRREGEARGW